VDVFAPGGDLVAEGGFEDLLLSPCSASNTSFDCSDGQSYLIGAGTSFAVPHVVAQAAVIESEFAGDQNDGFLARCILMSADPVTGRRIDRLYDRGRINVLRGAECARATTTVAAAAVPGK
jgi:subtilisin family serine protease